MCFTVSWSCLFVSGFPSGSLQTLIDPSRAFGAGGTQTTWDGASKSGAGGTKRRYCSGGTTSCYSGKRGKSQPSRSPRSVPEGIRTLQLGLSQCSSHTIFLQRQTPDAIRDHKGAEAPDVCFAITTISDALLKPTFPGMALLSKLSPMHRE